MRNKENKPALSSPLQAIGVATLLLLAACATEPPAAAPKIDRVTAATLEARMPPPLAVVSIDEIIAMSKRGESVENLIGRIDATHSRYRLDATTIAAMLSQGVAIRVIDHMIESERRRIFDDMAADIARRDQTCLERIEQEARQCRLQTLQPGFATCWPAHATFPYWRCL